MSEEMIFRSYGRGNSEIGVKCCDKLMNIKNLKGQHFNDHPFTLECEVCKNKLINFLKRCEE